MQNPNGFNGSKIDVFIGDKKVGTIESIPADKVLGSRAEGIFELGSLPDPLAQVPKPDAKKVAEMYFGKGNPWIDHSDLRWQSDWNGEEVGHPDITVVGLYIWRDTGVNVYINADTNEIVDVWEEKEE